MSNTKKLPPETKVMIKMIIIVRLSKLKILFGAIGCGANLISQTKKAMIMMMPRMKGART